MTFQELIQFLTGLNQQHDLKEDQDHQLLVNSNHKLLFQKTGVAHATPWLRHWLYFQIIVEVVFVIAKSVVSDFVPNRSFLFTENTKTLFLTANKKSIWDPIPSIKLFLMGSTTYLSPKSVSKPTTIRRKNNKMFQYLLHNASARGGDTGW